MRTSIAVVVLALAGLVGCGTGTPKCTPGMSIACTGLGGCTGGQVCGIDGIYGTCVCGGTDAGMADSGMTDSGMTDTGTPDTGTPDTGAPDTGAPDTGAPDSGPDAGPPPCDPLAQTGCATGERCTWARVTGSATVGHAACTSAGTAHALEACTVDSATGIDDCVAGLACDGIGCGPICDFAATAPTGYACSRYSDFFTDATGMTTGIGIGTPTCDPITQIRDADGAPACASPDTSTPTRGCYGVFGGPYSCAPAGPLTNTEGTTPAGGAGSPFLNGCAPGFIPLQPGGTGAFICTAYCTPTPTSLESHPTPGGAAPHNCAARGAAAPNECRYSFFVAPTHTPDGNRVGVCFDYTTATSAPSCAALSSTATDYGTWGCAPAP